MNENIRSWQEPLEMKIATLLIKKIPEDCAAINLIIDKLNSGWKVVSFLPENNLEVHLNEKEINNAIIEWHGEFKGKKMAWKNIKMQVFYFEEKWQYNVKYEYFDS
jgi:hypothetical protein